MCPPFPAAVQLLTLAVPRGPAGLSTPDPGAVLALACHVVMVQAGFQVSTCHVSAIVSNSGARLYRGDVHCTGCFAKLTCTIARLSGACATEHT
jgi:hypothetical protein